MIRKIAKIFAVVATAVLTCCVAIPAFAAFQYEPITESLPIINAVETFDLVDDQAGKVIQSYNFKGEDVVKLTFDEPGAYSYTLKSTDKVNTTSYKINVQVDNKDGKLAMSDCNVASLDTGAKVNKVWTVALKVVKGDSENPSKTLPGATYAIYKMKADGTAESEPFTTVTTGADGTAPIVNLQPGTYALKEVTAPEGYEIDPNFIKFEVVEDVDKQTGKPFVKVVTDRVKQNPDGTVSVTAVDKATPSDNPGGWLPQTGQLWWPVIAMALAGMLLIFFGIKLRNRKED